MITGHVFVRRADQKKVDAEEMILDDEMEKLLSELLTAKYPQAETSIVEGEAAQSIEPPPTAPAGIGTPLTLNALADLLYAIAPTITLFDHSTGLLPSYVDIDENKYILTGQGNVAARNFLTVAGLDLKQLVTSEARTRESLLLKANDSVTKDFATFWSQTIGKKSKLNLACTVETYGPEAGDKAGKKHLLFWISDGLSKLYPKQRSQGGVVCRGERQRVRSRSCLCEQESCLTLCSCIANLALR